MAREPVESSQCWVCHEPTSSGARGADDSAVGPGGSGGGGGVAPPGPRSHTARTGATPATPVAPAEPLRPLGRVRRDVDSLVIPDRGGSARGDTRRGGLEWPSEVRLFHVNPLDAGSLLVTLVAGPVFHVDRRTWQARRLTVCEGATRRGAPPRPSVGSAA